MMDDREKRLKRLAIRSWRRGTKEMDLILGPFWDAHGAALDEGTLSLYEDLLSENDQDLYQWVSGQVPAPEKYIPIVERLVASR
ncbi:MAG: succinate dehydrogenase assembly factor 2 [Silicimonas sp.]|nr:succinate dehydrogenase assembly factor 2 [Silicimonas sp.]